MVKDGQRVIGYIRCSTGEQANSGLGLDSQRAAIESECERKGLELVDVVADEGESGKSLARPGLKGALQRVADGEANVLMAAKLDRISRSVVDFGNLLEWFSASGAALVALDLNIDTSTSSGRLVANVMSSVAEWERDVIAERTRNGLAALRARGEAISRPAVADNPEIAQRIAHMRRGGMTYQAIADDLNGEGVPTLRGASEWRVSSVQAAAGYKRRPKRRATTDLPVVSRR